MLLVVRLNVFFYSVVLPVFIVGFCVAPDYQSYINDNL